MKRGVGTSSRVPRPNTLNVDLGYELGVPSGPPVRSSPRSPMSPSPVPNAGPASARLPIKSPTDNPNAPSSFNDELNRFLQDDQQQLAGGGDSSRPQLQNGARKQPIAGRRQAGSVNSPSNAATLAAQSAAAIASLSTSPNILAGMKGVTLQHQVSLPPVAQSARGPRPRNMHASSVGANTARQAAKEAAAASANASARERERDRVSDDEESAGEDELPSVNSVSSNAAAALYASFANNNSNSNGHSPAHTPNVTSSSTTFSFASSATAFSSNLPPSQHPQLAKYNSSPPTVSHYPPLISPTNQNSTNSGSSSQQQTPLASPTTPQPPQLPQENYSGNIVAGGGLAGEKDPNLKWANVDSFALGTPKQKTGNVLLLSNYLVRSPATPHSIDKVRAIFRWICEFITWVPPPKHSAVTSPASSPSHHSSASKSTVTSGASLPRSVSTPVTRQRGVSEASQLAKDQAKAVAESKMAESASAQAVKRGSVMHAAHGSMEDDEDDEDGEGGSGSSRNGPQVDLLTDVTEILRRRRASSEGLCNLFQQLVEAAGLDCIKIHGYGKGCGLIEVAERFDHPNHFWSAVKLGQETSSWMLVDLAWSSAYINQGKLEKTFTNCYWKPNPTIFALQHFPVVCHPGKRTLTKQIQEFVKMPEKMQFLEQTLSTSSSGTAPKKVAITKVQFEDAMSIERGYLDLGILMSHPVGVHTVRHDTPLYTITLEAPITLEFTVGMNFPNRPKTDVTNSSQPPPAARFVDQCWHVNYVPLQDDPNIQRVEISFVFPWKGSYTITVRARRLASKLLTYDDLIHYRFLSSCGLYDIRRDPVLCGFLARRIVVGADHEFEHKFAVLKPLKGHFELNQSVRLQLAAPIGVTRMVAVNNGRWIELVSSPSGASSGPLKNRQIFEGDLKLVRFPDIQISYKTKGQQFNLLYKYGVTEGLGVDSAGNSNKSLSPTASSSSSSSTLSDYGSDIDENKHGKIVLDSRGTCFEKRLHITSLKIGKRSCAIAFETKAGVQVKAEVRAGWTSAQKVNDKIQVLQTGTRQAAGGGEKEVKCACLSQPCPHTQAAAATPQYDIVTWDVTTQLSEPGDYSIHLFLSSAGSGVFRFALVLHLRMDDKAKAGFNLDI